MIGRGARENEKKEERTGELQVSVNKILKKGRLLVLSRWLYLTVP